MTVALRVIWLILADNLHIWLLPTDLYFKLISVYFAEKQDNDKSWYHAKHPPPYPTITLGSRCTLLIIAPDSLKRILKYHLIILLTGELFIQKINNDAARQKIEQA